MNLKQVVLGAGIVLSGASSAQALSISIWEAPDGIYQNNANNPCMFNGNGGAGCNQDPAGWPPPATDTNGDFSTLTRMYAGADYTAFTANVTSSFILGLDINDSSDAQTLTTLTLDFFDAGNVNVGSYSFSPALAVPSIANGVGFADYILSAGCSGTITDAGVNPDIDECSSYTSFVRPATATKLVATFGYATPGTTGDGNDGPDRIFAISGTVNPCPAPPCGINPLSPVPEPGSMLLLGTGLMGAAAAVRRRRTKKS